MKDKLLKKLQEPSTWAGLAALAALLGQTQMVADQLAQAGMAVSGIAAVLLGESGNG